MSTLVVLRKRPDGTHGLLNIVENGDKLQAERFAQGWAGHFPGDPIVIKAAYADKCRPVNNLDGFK